MLIDEALDILKARLETIDGLTVTTNDALPITEPMAVIMDGEVDYNESFRRGACLLSFTVTVYVSKADSDEGLYEARRYLSANGEKSVSTALETQPAAGDLLLNKVSVATGERSESDNYITAVFEATTHVPGEVTT